MTVYDIKVEFGVTLEAESQSEALKKAIDGIVHEYDFLEAIITDEYEYITCPECGKEDIMDPLDGDFECVHCGYSSYDQDSTGSEP